MNVFFLVAFCAMLFYGIVTLLPNRSAGGKKQKRKAAKVAEAVIAILISTSGLVLMVFALIVQNNTAQTVYYEFIKYAIIVGIALYVVDFIRKLTGKGKKNSKRE